MAGTHWIVEGKINPKWPLYTRANAGEVYPFVITTLCYDLTLAFAEAGWRDAYRQIGISKPGDFDSDDMVICSVFAGYSYLNVSYLRMVGVRAPGSSAEAIDATLFGEGNPPPYVPRPGDKSLASTLKILRTVIKTLGTSSEPPEVAESYQLAAKVEAKFPGVKASNEELLAYLRDFSQSFRSAFRLHIVTTSLAGIVCGVLTDAAKAAGEPGLAGHLIGAVGDVLSATYSHELYKIGQIVRASPDLTATFDAGVSGIYLRLRSMPAAAEFNREFSAFLGRHGHRGPNDWELSSATWEIDPELALVAVDRLRLADQALSSTPKLADVEKRQRDALAKVLQHVPWYGRGSVKKAIRAAPIWTRAREATRDRAVRAYAPIKRAFRELVRRAAENGGVDDAIKVALLRNNEFERYLADPRSMVGLIEERWALRERFSRITPPFFINGADEIPTLEQLEATQPQEKEVSGHLSVGDILRGDGGSPGVVRGRARVVSDPADARGLQPGEILIAPHTDPAWTPLFLAAGAVIVNVGALMSHAVIVSRELGIPCVVAVAKATEKIPDGTLIEVDGSQGTVKLLEAPEAALAV